MAPSAVAEVPSPVDVLLAEWGRSSGERRLVVDPADEMLAFLRDLHAGDAEQALCDYYRSGASIAATLRQVLRWRFGDLAALTRADAVLDFASGYGRVTRFLLDELPASAVTVADIQPAAVDFQRRTFGVQGAVSAAAPGELGPRGPYAAVLVTSLFSHLPEERFASWLAALLARVAPGGLLAFSTHDLALLPAEQRPAAGICFQPRSEIAALPAGEYGSSWVDEPFVRAALAASGQPCCALRFERALCNYQDLWVVLPEPGPIRDLALRAEPEVMVEQCDVSGGRLALAGWAHARHGRVSRIEAVLDGVLLASSPVSGRHEGLAAARGPAGADAAWRIDGQLPAGPHALGSTLLLRAVDPEGLAWPVWAGRLGTLLVQTAALREREQGRVIHHLRCEVERLDDALAWAGHEKAALRARIAAMENSRFWKLRRAWFAVKRALGLTEER